MLPFRPHACGLPAHKQPASMQRLVQLLIFTACGLVFSAPTALADSPSAWYEGFEGPKTTWKDIGGDAQYRVERHARVRDRAHSGSGSEAIALVGSEGTYVRFAHQVGRALVIEDLLATLWIKSDRHGLQVAAEVVLPRTTDPRTGNPIVTLVRGSSYTKVGNWQQLRIDNFPTLLTRQIRTLRMAMSPHVDGREAYVTRIVLNVYGGQGTTNTWIDDLDLAGFVPAPAGSWTTTDPPNDRSTPGSPSAPAAAFPQVELIGSVLTIDGRPLLPRIIRHQGEPLEFLGQLGFNTVWLDRPATPELLAQARQTGLWLVCPPPLSPSTGNAPDDMTAPAEIGSQYDRVLAWDLGRRLGRDHLDGTMRWAEQIRTADRNHRRLLICSPDMEVRKYSRHVDLLLADRRPLGTSLELADYGTWLRRQPLLATPGTPSWTTVQTQYAAALIEQLAAIEPTRTDLPAVSTEQIRLLVYTAIASGSRGLLFESQSRLDTSDPATRRRAAALELINLQLRLIEPWIAAGTPTAVAEGSRPEVQGMLLQTDRARLLVSLWTDQGAQWVPGQSADTDLSLIVPRVPASSEAYELTSGGLRPLDDRRVAGGTRVTFDEFELTAQALLSQNPAIVAALADRCTRAGSRTAGLQRDLAGQKLDHVVRIVDELRGRGIYLPSTNRWIDAARMNLRQSDSQLAARRYQAAALHAQRVMSSLRLVERAYWEKAVEGLPSPLSSPATAGFATLPWHDRLLARIRASQMGPNRLAGGQFESLGQLQSAGWRHFQTPSKEILSRVDISARGARSGGSGVVLSAMPVDPENPPAMVETPPVWITTPPISLEPGQLVCIHGWIRIPEPITGSVDGLMIVDSLSGRALAQRIGQTEGWQQFVLYRTATRSGPMTVSFVLSGLGEARLDDVAVQTLHPPSNAGMARSPAAGPRSR